MHPIYNKGLNLFKNGSQKSTELNCIELIIIEDAMHLYIKKELYYSHTWLFYNWKKKKNS